jgi:NAD(P)-dependent dehydrogenase (short-subunit alcohol dehydrogenase family)
MATFKYINKLEDKHVLVFGGTSGIGYAVAEALIEHKARLTIIGSNTDRLANTVKSLLTAYPDTKDGRVNTIFCDLSQLDGLEARIRETLRIASADGSQKIDHIAFTAGDPLNVAGGITGTDIELINTIMGVRAFAPVLIAKVIATSAYVNISAASSFTFTSGTAHLRPRKTWPVVSMLSAELHGLASGLAVELAPVRVNVVNPGFFQTRLAARFPTEVLEKTREAMLTKRLGQPEDIAEAYLYIMKDTSADGTSVLSDCGKVLAG